MDESFRLIPRTPALTQPLPLCKLMLTVRKFYMSGIVGHVMYGVLAAKAARERKLPIAPILYRHYASFLAGSYLGCDVPTMPSAICVDTGQEVGYGSLHLEKSPITGGKVKQWKFKFGEKEYLPKENCRVVVWSITFGLWLETQRR